MIEVDEKYMARCITLARNGKGNTSPNPMVGAVIVHRGRIIGEGFHCKYGETHAEVNAIASVKDDSLLHDSTLYVSLEPCSHYGKTPPCAELIIRKHIPRVVIACLDPFSKVSGRGVRMLQAAGVEVTIGVMKQEAYELNLPFMITQMYKRPYIVLKWAQSADGFMDYTRHNVSESPAVLSSSETMRRVHKLRSEMAGIMVGTNTALLDNPALTVRQWSGKSPVRIVLDRNLILPSDYKLLDGSVSTLIFTEKEMPPRPNVEFIRINFTKEVLPQILNVLYERKIDSLMVEGGPFLLDQFVRLNLWDRIRIETAPVCLNEGVKAPNVNWLQKSAYTRIIGVFSENHPVHLPKSSGRFIMEYIRKTDPAI